MSELHYHFPAAPSQQPRLVEVDLCAYGSSPAGITAVLEAVARGHSVALVVNHARIGGLTSGGLGNTDIGNRAAIGGLARGFYRRVGARYGVAEEWRFEPGVAEDVFTHWLQDAGIAPFLREFVSTVTMDRGRLRELHCESGLTIRARYFIDASYEGDLMALAGVRHTSGREANAVYGELLNGVQLREQHQFELPVDPYLREGDPASGLLPDINPQPVAAQGSGDRLVQAYTFRACLTQSPDRLPIKAPDGYDPLRYELLARYFRLGCTRNVFRKFDHIRNGKTDTNNFGALSTDLIGGAWDFPHGDYRTRERIFQDHVNYQRGLFWFLGHDPRVPGQIRREMLTWGLPADEFQSTGGWSPHLYIREARRMVADYVVTELDCRGYRRADDGVGLGAYGMDSHNCQRVVVDGVVRNEGNVQVGGFPPYPVSYRSIVPGRGQAANLFVPVCVSASHIAYGSVRMEPVFMILGQSAAIAADLLMTEADADVQSLRYSRLKPALESAGQIVSWNPQAAPARYEAEAPPPPSAPAPVRAEV